MDLFLLLFGSEAMPRGGDVEIGEIGAAEGGAGDQRDRYVDLMRDPGVRRITAHPASAEQRDPDAAFSIDDHSVRKSFRWRDLHEGAAVGNGAGFQIEVKDVDALSWAVDVIHAAPVRAPVDAIGNGQPAENALRAKCAVHLLQSIKRTCARQVF